MSVKRSATVRKVVTAIFHTPANSAKDVVTIVLKMLKKIVSGIIFKTRSIIFISKVFRSLISGFKFAARLSRITIHTPTRNAIITICRTLPSTNGLNRSSGTASNSIEIICPTKTLLSPSGESTGNISAHEHIDAPIISNIFKTKRRMTRKPISFSVAMSSIMQMLDTTEIKIVGIVTPTISSIRFDNSGAVKSWTIKF